MKFTKYPSIENSYRREFVDKIVLEEFDKGAWIIQEKAHGANFSFWYDGEDVRLAKRTCFIGDDDFYGIQNVMGIRYSHIKELYWQTAKDFIAVYGELIGGTYPHPEVPKTEAKKIQKGIYYCPDTRFYIYDIKVDDVFLSAHTIEGLCEELGLLYAKTIFEGTFKECLEYPNDFQSKISEWIGLPPIEDNICEGIVIRPAEPKFFYNHSRVILKSKNEKWAEKQKVKKKVIKKLSKMGETICAEMVSFITENRYSNVVSKIGEVKMSDFGKILGEFGKDVHEEFMKDNKIAIEYLNLEKTEQKIIKRRINSIIANLIREKLSSFSE